MVIFSDSGAHICFICFAALVLPALTDLRRSPERQLHELHEGETHIDTTEIHNHPSIPQDEIDSVHHAEIHHGSHHHREERGHAPESEEARIEHEELEVEYENVDLAESLMLLGGICFVMALFYLVNHQVPDMQFYSWHVISTTISIFVSVFMFSSINIMVNQVLLADRGNLAIAGGAFAQMMAYFIILQVSAAWLTGALHEKPFRKDKTRAHPRLKRVVSVSILEQKQEAERHVKCWTTLLAHMTGFAAINFGGVLQHGQFFRRNPLLTFGAGPLMYLVYIVLCWISRRVRRRVINSLEEVAGYEEVQHDDEEEERGGRYWAMVKWDNEVYEAEVDIAGLCVSFLTVQACRYNITGVLPDNLGIEELNFVHPRDCTYKLLGCSLLFCLGLVCTVMILSRFPKKVTPGTIVSLLKRMVIVFQNVMAMAFAWSLLYAFKWELARFPRFGSPNAMTARLLLAILISFVAFALIYCLDMFAESDLGGHAADDAIFSIIGGLGILVGFSWEQSFDGGVEVIAALTPNPLLAEVALALVVTTVVMPAWQRYILHTVIKLSEEREEKQNKAKEASRDCSMFDCGARCLQCSDGGCCGQPRSVTPLYETASVEPSAYHADAPESAGELKVKEEVMHFDWKPEVEELGVISSSSRQ
eukprot:gnl/MRDRNA2_/MRDRNA2_18643_c0_seq1.p1 gnl/MRDRNA2_/MRDRNA2_18643_c0~~gnl/MRDRNA2_/MRDRNA2_18643_c0_seq1.p1  ORF type:complete len:648 (+),score=105.56 gnl/MRDRNA2_/MRDRNA2_18643_c0_seq1:42-1985(+)